MKKRPITPRHHSAIRDSHRKQTADRSMALLERQARNTPPLQEEKESNQTTGERGRTISTPLEEERHQDEETRRRNHRNKEER